MIMKTILSILFLFVCAFAHAQYHNVEGIRVVGRSDSTTISNIGQIQFDADDDKLRFNDGTGWFSVLKEGATLPYWPLSGTETLTTNTVINASNFNLTLGTLGTSQIGSFNLGATSAFIRGGSTSNYGGLFADDNELNLFFQRSAGSAAGVFMTPASFRVTLDGGTNEMFLIQTNSFSFGDFDVAGDKTFLIEGADENLIFDTDGGVLKVESGYTSSGEFDANTLIPKSYADTKWPLTGTADLTGNTVIDGNNFDLTIGSTNRLNTATIRADSDISLNSDAGTNQAFITVSPGGGLIRLSFSTDDGSSEESGILIQSAGDEIIITAGGSEAIVVESDGDIKMNVTRTDCTGADAGTVYSVAGVLNICP